ncbi:PilX N-terminal domain-containing pilus assembly protein [Arhodomonas aquaeolei]|uniref:PilX N-terminal domain-containing pilus assembly protein n=1 Tax=Arhodomonas aquaeolei TaxID=2369 RepID=UPI00035E9384|nr:PilX N-terminal domain-containing pilus assembly protein [Arhodomonas aquaeolei]
MTAWNRIADLSRIGRQRGAALAISLVILLVLTLVAVTASQVSRMQEAMSGNAQQERTIFQTTYSAISWALNKFSDDPSTLASAIDSDGTENVSMDESTEDRLVTDRHLQLSTLEVTHTGQGCPSGFSCKNFEGHYFDVDSEASIAGTGANSSQTQGIMRVTPKD